MAVVSLDITHRTPFADGVSFGAVGPYNLLEGTAHFAVDPLHPRNAAITDIELAPRHASGRVTFTAHFAMLQPRDPQRGNRRLLFDVVNRGRKTVLQRFNSAPAVTDHTAPLQPGNGFLMRHGYTVVWCGWQADVPPVPGLIGLQAPQALGPDGQPLTGRILCQFQANEQTPMFLLADRDHLPHPPADVDEPEAMLTVRHHPNEPATPIPREQWSFVQLDSDPEPYYVHLHPGFEAGRVYQLVYTTRGSTIVGLGFAAVRDIVSFLKYAGSAAGNPCAAAIDYAYVFGISQSGRFLRQMLYVGLVEDEEERLALDGVIPHVGGAMRGEFNLRFGQPSKDVCYIMPEMFPFTDTPQIDPVSGASGSLLARLEARGKVPKIMFTNASAEYWRGDAALIHTDLARMTDAPESPAVRRYHFAGTQHGSGLFPLVETRPADGIRGQLPFNSVDYTPLLRAALSNLDRWVSQGVPAPPSRHPSLRNGTAVPSDALKAAFSVIPGVRFPPQPPQAIRLDYGPETAQGRTVTLPAIPGAPYPALVAAVDADGNEVAGIRLPDLTVPLATHTGWNLRHDSIGNPDLVIGITGGLAGWTLPFPVTRADREATNDPRPAIAERYASLDDYLQRVRTAALALVEEGYVLAEDVEAIVTGAAARYRAFTSASAAHAAAGNR
jgi:hypothetical protein